MPSLRRSRALAALMVALPVAARVSLAQPKAAAGSPSAPRPSAAPAAPSEPSAATTAPAADPLAQIVWQGGPTTATLGGVARVNVPASCRLTDAAGAALFTQGGPDQARGDEIGVVLCASAQPDGGHWYAVLRYEPTGRVPDGGRDSLDADAILGELRRQSTADSEARRKRGEPVLPLSGWLRPPAYDAATFTMTWSTLYSNGNPADETVVHSVRHLGREGVLRTDLVVSPDDYGKELEAFEQLMDGVSYVDGKHYADWKEGDRVAEYGLAALATGQTLTAAQAGALVGIWLAVKMVLLKLKLLGKKVIAAAIAALCVLIRTWWRRRRATA